MKQAIKKMPVLVCTLVTLFAMISVVNSPHNQSYMVEPTSKHHSKECPLFFHYNSTLQECQCSQSSMFTCRNGQHVSFSSNHLTTYSHKKGIVSLSFTKRCWFLKLTNLSNSPENTSTKEHLQT